MEISGRIEACGRKCLGCLISLYSKNQRAQRANKRQDNTRPSETAAEI